MSIGNIFSLAIFFLAHARENGGSSEEFWLRVFNHISALKRKFAYLHPHFDREIVYLSKEYNISVNKQQAVKLL